MVSVAARDRLHRWAEYLRSFTFTTVHIPGAENHFCDLLSRDGCTEAVHVWERQKEPPDKGESYPPQMAIIQPHTIHGSTHTCSKDLDIKASELMVNVLGRRLPTPLRIQHAQEQANIETDKRDATLPYPLYVNVAGKVAIPRDSDVTNEIIAVCHQGDHIHRSATDTLREFRRHFYMYICMQRRASKRRRSFGNGVAGVYHV